MALCYTVMLLCLLAYTLFFIYNLHLHLNGTLLYSYVALFVGLYVVFHLQFTGVC